MNPIPAKTIAVREPPGRVLPKLKKFGALTGLVRPLRGGDEAQLREFFSSHSADTIYERYGCLISTMTAERASQLVNVDQARDCALGIFEPTDDGERLHAVGRYCLDPKGGSAELAFVVRETMRRRGMATTLLQMLVRAAQDRGLLRLWAQVNAQNSDMLGLFQHHGFTLTTQPDLGIVRATLALAVPPTQADAAAGNRRRPKRGPGKDA